MRDRVGDDVVRHERLLASIRRVLRGGGYVPVKTPAFEYESVVSQGLGRLAPSGFVRFVEAATGRVCVLRPDITAQVARLVSTRLRAVAPPIRLCTEGSVVRVPRDRSRPDRQIPQAGVELFGVPSPEGEVEVISLAVRAVRGSGLRPFLLELANSTLAARALAPLPREAQAEVREHLKNRDADAVSRLLDSISARPEARVLERLPNLFGGSEVLSLARRIFKEEGSRAAIRTLEAVARRLARVLPRQGISFDFGEVHGWDYYTGIRFSILADGPGVPVVSGGRYDTLLSRYGRDLCATGFAVDLESLGTAIQKRAG